MKTPTAYQILHRAYGDSKNFMTPRIISRGKIKGYPDVAWELSEGKSFENEPIYGVSLARYNPETEGADQLFDVSKMFRDYHEARLYIQVVAAKMLANPSVE